MSARQWAWLACFFLILGFYLAPLGWLPALAGVGLFLCGRGFTLGGR